MKARRKTVVVTHKVSVLDRPVRGCATYTDKGVLVMILGGAYLIGGRVSNHFKWAAIKPDGRLGKRQSGYWRHAN